MVRPTTSTPNQSFLASRRPAQRSCLGHTLEFSLASDLLVFPRVDGGLSTLPNRICLARHLTAPVHGRRRPMLLPTRPESPTLTAVAHGCLHWLDQ